jgi:hypothetical protein
MKQATVIIVPQQILGTIFINSELNTTNHNFSIAYFKTKLKAILQFCGYGRLF